MKTGIGLISAFGILLIPGSCINNTINPNSEMGKTDTEHHEHTNELIHETSPYLLQHAHNPVNWVPWSKEVFKLAESENKLVLISIGYSACHWCHVMERESFEDDSVAAFMNKHFICVKVDREERPDVDQVYMSAVQIMTGRGGWPLNCFTLPDGRPFYGGTYFQKEQWKDIMQNLVTLYEKNPEKVIEYAENLTKGIRHNETLVKKEVGVFDSAILHETVEKWRTRFDEVHGGPNQEPKFPMPNNYLFLMQYAKVYDSKEVSDHVDLTLRKMAFGGIYDQIGGGFARYSVDGKWKVPHFEKMLYDNAQLMFLYSEAYKRTGEDLYKDVVYGIYDFLKRDLTGEDGVFYSALDADSEGVEGKYYLWDQEELKTLLGENADLAVEYYNVGGKGKWEHGKSILLRDKSDSDIIEKFGLKDGELKERLNVIRESLLKARSKRVEPGLDDKTLTSWNALTVVGLLHAYEAFGDRRFYAMAIDNLNFILEKQKNPDGSLNHSYKKGKSTIDGFLEDYCFVAEALLKAYQTDFNEKWLEESRRIVSYVIEHFYNKSSGMFVFTNRKNDDLIAVPTEYQDNVIPASNSSMAKVLFTLGTIDQNENYMKMSDQMLSNVTDAIPGYGSGFSNWAQLLLWRTEGLNEVVITGKKFEEYRKKLAENYLPNAIFMGAERKSDLPLFEGKFMETTTIFVCVDRYCKEPTQEVEMALKQL